MPACLPNKEEEAKMNIKLEKKAPRKDEKLK